MTTESQADEQVLGFREDLLDGSGQIVAAQQYLAKQIGLLLGQYGFLHHSFENTKADASAMTWTWEDRTNGHKIVFKNPYFRNKTRVLDEVIERGRQPESALSLRTSNRSGAQVTRSINETHTIFTNSTVSNTNTFSFSVTAGAEVGLRGVDLNSGAHALISFESTFGGEFIQSWINERGSTVSRSINDTIVLEPYGEYQINVLVDRLELEQNINVSGILDFEIDFTPADTKNGDSQRLNTGETLSVNSVDDFVRNMMGLTGSFQRQYYEIFPPGDPLLTHSGGHSGQPFEPRFVVSTLDILKKIVNVEPRTIQTTTTIGYNDAGASTFSVERIGTWRYDHSSGSWVLNTAGASDAVEYPEYASNHGSDSGSHGDGF